ncbi:DNA methyltransferase [Spirillospora sp. NBC_00431]
MNEIAFHPVADIFPMMSDREFSDLVADITEHGLREPVWLHSDGRIIDGRNRYRACLKSGVEPQFRIHEGSDADLVALVVSLNLHRRHLNESQRSMVAARIAKLPLGANQHGAAEGVSIDTPSLAEAAEMMNVGRASAARAKKVQEKAVPELAEKVESGDVAVSTAATIAEAPEEEQREVIAADDEKAIVRKANEIKRRKREEREQAKEEERRNADATPLVTIDAEIRHCPLTKLDLEPDSVDLIFTDPPYPSEFLPLWSDLGALAAKALKPGGLVVAYTGQMFLPEVMRRMGEHLPYWWTYAVTHTGAFFQLMARRTQVGWKPLLVYRKPGGAPFPAWTNDIVTEGRSEKTGHEWQQAEAEAAYWIEKLSRRGDLIVDPFLGSGTTAAASVRLGRRFIGCDVDPLAVARTKERVA